MFMVAAELIAASRGLGYLLSDGRETSRADIVLAAIVLLAVLGKFSDMAMAATRTPPAGLARQLSRSAERA
jgi:sulfonate transport system permease protein